MSSKKKTTTVSFNLPSGSSLVAPATGVKTQGKGKKKAKKGNSLGRQVSMAAATSTGVLASNPRIQSGDGRVRVSHREFLCDVTGQAAFTTVSRAVNPGLNETFRWLSNLARMYESYRFVSLRFDYVTSVGTAKEGAVMMAVDYDAFDFSPPTKQEFLMQHGATRGSVWSNVSLVCDTQDLHKFGTQRYTRAGSLDVNLDVKTYDVGQFLFATTGYSSPGGTCGEIYVSYVVDLFTPQPPYWPDWGAERLYTQQATPETIFGMDTVKVGDLGITVTNWPGPPNSGTKINFKRRGWYSVLMETLGTLEEAGSPRPFLEPASSTGTVYTHIGEWLQDGPAKNLTMGKLFVPSDSAYVTLSLTGYQTISNVAAWFTPFADI